MSGKKSKFNGLEHVHTFPLYHTVRSGIRKHATRWVEDYTSSFERYGCEFRVRYQDWMELGDSLIHCWKVDIYAIPESRIRHGVTGIRCGKCNSEVVSLYRHDFRYCRCGACFIDGGFDYTRIGWPPDVKCEYIDCVVDMGTGKILESRPAEVRKPAPQELIEIEQEVLK